MGKGKQQKRKPQGPVTIMTHRALPATTPWYEVLDRAIETQFPNLRASTVMTARGYNTNVTTKNPDDRLMPRQHRVVSAFIAGFMACERSY